MLNGPYQNSFFAYYAQNVIVIKSWGFFTGQIDISKFQLLAITEMITSVISITQNVCIKNFLYLKIHSHMLF